MAEGDDPTKITLPFTDEQRKVILKQHEKLMHRNNVMEQETETVIGPIDTSVLQIESLVASLVSFDLLSEDQRLAVAYRWESERNKMLRDVIANIKKAHDEQNRLATPPPPRLIVPGRG